MFVRWNFTVCSATQSSLPIASFDRPRASAFRIDVSRSVRPAALVLEQVLVPHDVLQRGVCGVLLGLPVNYVVAGI